VVQAIIADDAFSRFGKVVEVGGGHVPRAGAGFARSWPAECSYLARRRYARRRATAVA
jgi:hypothetical protein